MEKEEQKSTVKKESARKETKQAKTAKMAERTFKNFTVVTAVFSRLYKLRKDIEKASIDSASLPDVANLCKEACWLFDLIKEGQLEDEFFKYEKCHDAHEEEDRAKKKENIVDMFFQAYYN